MALFNFAGGLSQTDWFGLSTGVLGTGYAAAAYNQAAYFGSLGMRQGQLYQAKNYNIGWIAVARDDIRNMMNISVTRMTNYMLVATLILGVASDALLGANFDKSAPSYIQNAFWVSVGLSILFFTMSIMFGVKGQNDAIVKTVRLLAWELRPENPSAYAHDYMQANNRFEGTGLQSLFRLPGLRARFHEEEGSADHRSGDGKRDDCPHWMSTGSAHGPNDSRGDHPGASSSNQGWRSWVPGMSGSKTTPTKRAGGDAEASFAKSDDSNHDGKGPSLEQVHPITDELLYLARFGHYMQLWQSYDTHSKTCIGLGLISLSQSAAYYTVAHLISLNKYTSDFVIALMVSIFCVVAISVAAQDFHAKIWITKCALYLLFASGPILGVAAAISRDLALGMWLAPACMLSHALYYTCGWIASLVEFKKPWEATRKFTMGPSGQEFPAAWMANMDDEDPLLADIDVERGPREDDEAYAEQKKQDQFAKIADVQRPSAAESRKVIEVANKVQSVTRQGLGFAAIVWGAIAAVTVLDRWPGLALPFFAGGQGRQLVVQEVEMAWPILDFETVGLACGQGRMFTANHFQVFELNLATKVVEPYPCGVDQEIVDLSMRCDSSSGSGCGPVVLLEDSTLVECDTGTSIPLLQDVSADRVALLTAGAAATSSATSMQAGAMVVSNGTAIEMRWDEAQRGFSPLWTMQLLRAPDKMTGVDYEGDKTYIYAENPSERGWHYEEFLQVVEGRAWSSRQLYHLPYEFQDGYETVGFCSMTSDSMHLYVVQTGNSARLLHAAVPAD